MKDTKMEKISGMITDMMMVTPKDLMKDTMKDTLLD